MKKELTKRQSEILDYIKSYIASKKYPPTIRECADHFGVATKAIVDHFEVIERKGYITITPNIARGIVINDPIAQKNKGTVRVGMINSIKLT